MMNPMTGKHLKIYLTGHSPAANSVFLWPADGFCLYDVR